MTKGLRSALYGFRLPDLKPVWETSLGRDNVQEVALGGYPSNRIARLLYPRPPDGVIVLSEPRHGFNVRRVHVPSGEVQWKEELRNRDETIELCAIEEGLFGFIDHGRNRPILLRA